MKNYFTYFIYCITFIGFQSKLVAQESVDILANSFIKVEPGEFIMGSNKGRKNEKPAHKVFITEAYELGMYEVTQAFWYEVMCTTPADQLQILRKSLGKPNHKGLRGVGDRNPMCYVSWNEVQVFLSKLNSRSTSFSYRLPTEAEWEYAARAGTQTVYSFGNNESQLHEYGWYIENTSKTHPVGMKRPNAWGFYDMHGNVYEWVQDRADDYSRKSQTNPKGPSPNKDIGKIFSIGDSGPDRVMRGGSWGNPAKSSHSARRTINSPNSRSPGIGFRLVRMKKI